MFDPDRLLAKGSGSKRTCCCCGRSLEQLQEVVAGCQNKASRGRRGRSEGRRRFKPVRKEPAAEDASRLWTSSRQGQAGKASAGPGWTSCCQTSSFLEHLLDFEHLGFFWDQKTKIYQLRRMDTKQFRVEASPRSADRVRGGLKCPSSGLGTIPGPPRGPAAESR